MLKEYIQKKNIKISDISNTTGIPYSTCNDIVNGKTEIGCVRVETAIKIAEYLDLTLDELIGLCTPEAKTESYKIIRRNKAYYLEYEDNGKKLRRYLCKVNPLNTKYVESFAEWEYEDTEEEREVRKWGKYIWDNQESE